MFRLALLAGALLVSSTALAKPPSPATKIAEAQALLSEAKNLDQAARQEEGLAKNERQAAVRFRARAKVLRKHRQNPADQARADDAEGQATIALARARLNERRAALIRARARAARGLVPQVTRRGAKGVKKLPAVRLPAPASRHQNPFVARVLPELPRDKPVAPRLMTSVR